VAPFTGAVEVMVFVVVETNDDAMEEEVEVGVFHCGSVFMGGLWL
jgi:hypothetical protein